MIFHENHLSLLARQMILMKYHASFVIFEKVAQNLKLSSAADYRWNFMGYPVLMEARSE